jgi:hypothetical protein
MKDEAFLNPLLSEGEGRVRFLLQNRKQKRGQVYDKVYSLLFGEE